MRTFGVGPDLQVCGDVRFEADGSRGRCPRTPGILRFGPAAWYRSKAIPPKRRHRPCHWTAAALGVLASRALSSAAVLPEYLQWLLTARGKSSKGLMRVHFTFVGRSWGLCNRLCHSDRSAAFSPERSRMGQWRNLAANRTVPYPRPDFSVRASPLVEKTRFFPGLGRNLPT